jgi:hypothetical protein
VVLIGCFGGWCGVGVRSAAEFNGGESLVHIGATSRVRRSKGEAENERGGERPVSRRPFYRPKRRGDVRSGRRSTKWWPFMASAIMGRGNESAWCHYRRGRGGGAARGAEVASGRRGGVGGEPTEE